MQMKNINNTIVYEFIKDSFESLSFWNLHINIQKRLQFLCLPHEDAAWIIMTSC